MVGNSAKVLSFDSRGLLALPPTQFINAVPTCHLTYPGAEGIRIIFFVEDGMQFQKHLGRGILGVFGAAKEAATNLQNVAIVGGIDCAQDFGASLQRLVQGRAEGRFFHENRSTTRCHSHSFALNSRHTTSAASR
jgi:hypothetical protein